MSNFFEDIGLDSVANFFGADDRRAARSSGRRADEAIENAEGYATDMRDSSLRYQRDARELYDGDRDRYERLYEPMEESLAAEVMEDPDYEGAARDARDAFGTQFDLARDAERRNDMRYGVQPGSAQASRSADRSAFSRALGMSGAATEARRFEDDQAFLRKSQFFAQNGSGMKADLMNQLQGIYGADYASLGDQRAAALGESDYHQGVSDRHQQASGAGLNTVMQGAGLATSLYTGGAQAAAIRSLGATGAPAGAPAGGGKPTFASAFGASGIPMGGGFTPKANTFGGAPSFGSGQVNAGAFSGAPVNTPNANRMLSGAFGMSTAGRGTAQGYTNDGVFG